MSGPHPDPLSDMLSKPHELDGRFEREAKTVTTCISDAALTSIAVSLKRIADAMDGVAATKMRKQIEKAERKAKREERE